MNNWERLCKNVRYYTIGRHNSEMKEKDFECHFREYLRDIFNWYLDENGIRRQFPVYFGHEEQPKRTDIVILVDGRDERKRPSVAIELKWKVGLEDNDARVQLFSYMKQLETEFGILTNGISLQLFYKPLGRRGEPEIVFSNSYISSNKYGVELGEILDKKVYSEDKMRAFCEKMKMVKAQQKEGMYLFKSKTKNPLMEEQMTKQLDDSMLKLINSYKNWLAIPDNNKYIENQKKAASWVRANFFNDDKLKRLHILRYKELIREIPEHLTNLKVGACRTLYNHSLTSEGRKKLARSIDLINKTPAEECFGLIETLTTDDRYRIKGVGQSFWSEMLRCKFPNNMPLVNTKTIDFFQNLDLYIGIKPEYQHKNVHYCYSRWAKICEDSGSKMSLLELSHMEYFALDEEEGGRLMRQLFKYEGKEEAEDAD